MKQVLVKSGGVVVEDVPAPFPGPTSILVEVEFSCVSAGTEMTGVRAAELPLYRRVLQQPQNVRKVLAMLSAEGLRRTIDTVRGRLATGQPTGYSAAGRVVAVGAAVTGFAPGDRVACAGAGIANHAELIDVPVNLAARIPDGVEARWACTVTLGAIALQGVRRCNPTLGETVVVVGLGLLGQLTVQLLKANGCRVIGIDLDAARIACALAQGADDACNASDGDHVERIVRLTGGFGADASIITAAGPSDEIVSGAMRCCRRKGRVVLVGDVGLNLRREDFYGKELDFLVSTSYGPGRYDPSYEQGGHDYPIGYVRWTENRNMEAFLQALAVGSVKPQQLRWQEFPVERAADAYRALAEDSTLLLALLQFAPRAEARGQRIELRASATAAAGRIGVSVIGAGSFAQSVHLPNLGSLRKHFELRGIASRTGASATGVAQRFSAAFATTSVEEVLHDPGTHLVIIATRHDSHARLALSALRAGKNVLVEKPLAIDAEQLSALESYYAEASGTPRPVLMTGFNRRFAPIARRLRELLSRRAQPVVIHYRMNAGYLPPEHWVHGPEGGGRNIGEACHVYDLFRYLVGAPVREVSARAIRSSSRSVCHNDNFCATIGYEDGSLCTLTYTALGHAGSGKERLEAFCEGRSYVCADYRGLEVYGGPGAIAAGRPSKGQLEELKALAAALESGSQWPISAQEQFETTRLSLQIEAQLRG